MMRMGLWLMAILAPLQLFIGDQHGLNTLEASADQDRGDGGALGRQQARCAGAVCLAGREGGEKPFRNFHPARRVADPAHSYRRVVPRTEERAAAGPAAGAERVLRLPHHGRHRPLHDRGGAVRVLPVVARQAVSRRAGICASSHDMVVRLRRGDRRLGGHRKRPSALAGARHPAHRRRDLAGAGGESARHARAVRDLLRHRVLDGHLLHQPAHQQGTGRSRDRARGRRAQPSVVGRRRRRARHRREGEPWNGISP